MKKFGGVAHAESGLSRVSIRPTEALARVLRAANVYVNSRVVGALVRADLLDRDSAAFEWLDADAIDHLDQQLALRTADFFRSSRATLLDANSAIARTHRMAEIRVRGAEIAQAASQLLRLGVLRNVCDALLADGPVAANNIVLAAREEHEKSGLWSTEALSERDSQLAELLEQLHVLASEAEAGVAAPPKLLLLARFVEKLIVEGYLNFLFFHFTIFFFFFLKNAFVLTFLIRFCFHFVQLVVLRAKKFLFLLMMKKSKRCSFQYCQRAAVLIGLARVRQNLPRLRRVVCWLLLPTTVCLCTRRRGKWPQLSSTTSCHCAPCQLCRHKSTRVSLCLLSKMPKCVTRVS